MILHDICGGFFVSARSANECTLLLCIPVFPMPFSQQLDNSALSGSFYIYIPLLVLMHY